MLFSKTVLKKEESVIISVSKCPLLSKSPLSYPPSVELSVGLYFVYPSFNANKFLLDIENIDELRLVDKSKTNVEDDTLLIIDEPVSEELLIRKSQVDDDTIRGLYTDKQFKNGYSGYYNYSPSRKSFATGRELTNNSTAIGNKTGFAKDIIKKQKIQPVITTQKTPEVKPLKVKKKEPIKRSKY